MYNILLILEGNEEQTLFNIAKHDGFCDKFNVVLENAEGYGNIQYLYQYYISEQYFDLVLCVYDVDNRIEEKDSPYNQTRAGLYETLQDDLKVDYVSLCTNPNIIQFFLLGAAKLENVELKSTSKNINSKIIHKYWEKIGKTKEYDAKEWQLKIIEESYIYNDYKYSTLLENSKELPIDYKNNLPGSNLGPLLIALKIGDEDFIKDLIDKQNSK